MTTTARSTRSRKAADKAVKLETELNLPTAAGAPVDDSSILDGLLEQLESVEHDGSVQAIDSDVIEEIGAVQPDAGAVTADDALLEDIVADAERATAKAALYAEQKSATDDSSKPETTPEAVTGKGKKKGKGKKASAASEPAAGGEPEAPKTPKVPRATSVTHKPGDLLKAKLGAKASEFLIFSMNDAATLDQAGLEAKAQAFIDRMNDKDAIADKVREKIQMFFVWMMKGGGAETLNEVMRRALTVLHEQGELTSGDKGNLQLNLLSKPYSLGTARSQANQMFMAFPELGLTVKEKGKMVPNPDSALLPIAKQMLGLS